MMMSKEIDALHIHITKQHCHAHSITLPVHLLLRHIHILAIFFFFRRHIRRHCTFYYAICIRNYERPEKAVYALARASSASLYMVLGACAW